MRPRRKELSIRMSLRVYELYIPRHTTDDEGAIMTEYTPQHASEVIRIEVDGRTETYTMQEMEEFFRAWVKLPNDENIPEVVRALYDDDRIAVGLPYPESQSFAGYLVQPRGRRAKAEEE